MLRLILPLLAALAVAITACSSDEETIDVTGSPSPTATAIGDSITICGRVGVPGEATPSSPTPVPSCEPGDGASYVAPGIRGAIAEPPPLPSGKTALSNYIELTTDNPATGIVLSLPLEGPVPIGKSFAWYTYDSGQWLALNITVQIHESTISGQDAMAEGDFDLVPANLILLVEQ